MKRRGKTVLGMIKEGRPDIELQQAVTEMVLGKDVLKQIHWRESKYGWLFSPTLDLDAEIALILDKKSTRSSADRAALQYLYMFKITHAPVDAKEGDVDAKG